MSEITTKLNEVKITTSNPKEMFGKFISGRLLRTWIEEFADEETGEIVPIERNEIIADRGCLIDGDLMARINFYLQSGDIKEVTVSNQRREAYIIENTYLSPWLAVIQFSRGKKYKILLYASTIETAILIVKDYAELTFSDGFLLTSLKGFGNSIILKDSLKNIDSQELETTKDDEELVDLKFYKIEVVISSEEVTYNQSFVVETKDVEKALIVINNYISQEYLKNEKSMDGVEIKLEEAKIITANCFIDKMFSMAYSE